MGGRRGGGRGTAAVRPCPPFLGGRREGLAAVAHCIFPPRPWATPLFHTGAPGMRTENKKVAVFTLTLVP